MPTNPPGNFLGLDPDFDKGPIVVQWTDLGNGAAGKVHIVWESRQYVWDGVSAWVRATQAGGGASSGLTDTQLRASPVPMTIANLLGSVGTPATGVQTVQGVVGGVAQPVSGTFWQATQPVSIAASVAVTGAFWQATQPVSGTFWQATQPVSGTVAATKSGTWPLDTAAKGTTVAGSPTSEATDANTQSLHARVTNASLAVTGTFWQATQPVSGTFWQATQPVSGTVTANVGTTNGLALDATLTGGTQKAIARTAAKGTTIAGDLTSEATDANTQSLHTRITNASLAVTGTFWQATQPVSGTFWQATQPISGTVTANQGTANTAANAWMAKITDGTNVGAVKPASTLTVAADPAQVVAQSPMRADASTLSVTATGIAAAAVTLTLPAAAAGLFHYITSITIVKFATALLTAAATPVLVTSTNLPGSTVWSFSAAASAAGTNEVQTLTPTTPLKSSVAATATTVVGPATTATIWRITVTYYTSP